LDLRCPGEAHSELVVYPDRVLSSTISAYLKPVAKRQPQIAQVDGGIEIAKLAARHLDQIRRKALWALALVNGFRDSILEALDHDVLYQPMIRTSSYVSLDDTDYIWGIVTRN
jgi:hypothetical protein